MSDKEKAHEWVENNGSNPCADPSGVAKVVCEAMRQAFLAGIKAERGRAYAHVLNHVGGPETLRDLANKIMAGPTTMASGLTERGQRLYSMYEERFGNSGKP